MSTGRGVDNSVAVADMATAQKEKKKKPGEYNNNNKK